MDHRFEAAVDGGGIGSLAGRFSGLGIDDSSKESIHQVFNAVEAAENAIKQQVEENERLKGELERRTQELERYKLDSSTSQSAAAGLRDDPMPASYRAHRLASPVWNEAVRTRWMDPSFQQDPQGTQFLYQNEMPEKGPSSQPSSGSWHYRESSKMDGHLKPFPGGQNNLDNVGLPRLPAPPARSLPPSIYQNGEYDPRLSSDHGLMPVSETDNSIRIWKQEGQIRNEKYVLEKRIAYMRMAFDQQQQDLVDAASKALSYRQDIIEENIRLTYALQAAQQEKTTFVSSLLPLLAEYGLQPSTLDAQSVVSNLKVLFKHLQEKLMITENDKGLEIVPQTAYSQVHMPNFSPPIVQTARADWDVFGHPSNHVVSVDLPSKNIDHENLGRSPPPPRRDFAGQEMTGWGVATQDDSHIAHFHEDSNNQNPPFKDLTRHSEAGDSVMVAPQREVESSVNRVSGSSPYLAPGLVEPSSSFSPYLPPVLEEPSSSFSEAADDDPLPAIEGLQISGEPFPGKELQASGYSINGTTSCNFEWVRYLEDGSVSYIEGAKQPKYLVTADDVDSYLAIEVQPLDDRKRKGGLVEVFANEQRTITCGRSFGHMGAGNLGYQEGRYYLVRAGESEFERLGTINTNPVAKTSVDSGLSEEGKEQTLAAVVSLRRAGACGGSCWIWPSITQRAYQTAEIIAAVLTLVGLAAILCQNTAFWMPVAWEHSRDSLDSVSEVYASDSISPNIKPPPMYDGTPNESVSDVFVRVTQLMSVIETQYSGDTIVIISPDSDNLTILQAGLIGLDLRRGWDELTSAMGLWTPRGIVVTNDGNAILRELDIAHPAAKSMIELSRTQDEEVGDGTTSVIVLAGEMLHVAEAFIDKRFHPTVICRAYNKALEDALAVLDKIAMPIDTNDRVTMLGLVKSCIGTKFTSQFGDLVADLAIDATSTVGVDLGQGLREVDIKKYIKVEKVPGGQLEDSKVLKGVMFNKDVVAPGKMRRKIVNPRIILLDCPLEYKKGENQTNAELVREEDWAVLLKMEEEYIENLCVQILKFKPDLVITEKGLSDLACHYFSKAGVSAIRRLRKTDNNRIAKACGAVVVNRPEELQESDVGTGAGLFEVKKIGDEFFAFIVECKDPKACTVLLRGASKDLLNEVERNLQDAMSVARNILKNPKLVPGGGATELTVSATLKQKSSSIEGIEKWPYEAAAVAFEAIPRTLAQNCGVNVIRTMTALQGKHANGENAWVGIDGNTGVITDMKERKIWDAYNVKQQTFKTAIEAACMLLRIDDIVSGIKKKQAPGAGQAPKPQIEGEGDADNEQMIPE
ncbi:hypothetical protein QJS10_CPA03g00411 [Acorus calamus]|uniref:T-complex protein 1 subunit gamma n=1 Tax=Acorus calamus TaxID=4465 RepID=A0AAV9F7L1_ACOCL|nr:hypothetical protein QJS10_CPA03g00411 [Acorus calamus]